MSATHFKRCHFACLQCLYLFNACEFSELQPFSENRVFRPHELTRASVTTSSVSYINSQTLRLDLDVVVYKKRVMYIYKKMSGRRLSFARSSRRWWCASWATKCARRGRRTCVPLHVLHLQLLYEREDMHSVAALTCSRPPGYLPSASRSPSIRLKPEERSKRLTVMGCAKNYRILLSVRSPRDTRSSTRRFVATSAPRRTDTGPTSVQTNPLQRALDSFL